MAIDIGTFSPSSLSLSHSPPSIPTLPFLSYALDDLTRLSNYPDAFTKIKHYDRVLRDPKFFFLRTTSEDIDAIDWLQTLSKPEKKPSPQPNLCLPLGKLLFTPAATALLSEQCRKLSRPNGPSRAPAPSPAQEKGRANQYPSTQIENAGLPHRLFRVSPQSPPWKD